MLVESRELHQNGSNWQKKKNESDFESEILDELSLGKSSEKQPFDLRFKMPKLLSKLNENRGRGEPDQTALDSARGAPVRKI